MNNLIILAAIAPPILQSLLMGTIGYPLARRKLNGMEAFHRSGFMWWIITLSLILAAALFWVPEYLSLTTPSVHRLTVGRIGVTIVLGLVALGVAEAVAAWVDRRFPSSAAKDGLERYNSALPIWARTGPTESALVTLSAILEEAVYRGIALSGLLFSFGVSEAIGAGIVSFTFGAAHWYYGFRQILLKMVLGAVLCAVALSSGWIVAAVVHVIFNGALVMTASVQRQ